MSNVKSNIIGGALAVFSSIALCRLAAFVFQPEDYARIAEISLGVTTGYPVWKTFQNRVLGPYIIKALTFSPLDYIQAFIVFQIVTVSIAAFLCWFLGRKYGGNNQSALLALTVFVACFALILSPPWLYSWDLIDVIVFILFVHLVLAGMSLPWFIGLFAVAILNRDSALFVPLWLVLDPIVRFFCQRSYKLRPAAVDYRQILAGAACIVVGFLILESLKRNLIVEDVGPKLYPNVATYFGTYNIAIVPNVTRLKDSLTHFTSPFRFVIPIFLAIVIVLGAGVVRLDPPRYLALYLVELSFMASLFVFGYFYETRIYLPLIAFVVMSAVLLSRPRASN